MKERQKQRLSCVHTWVDAPNWRRQVCSKDGCSAYCRRDSRGKIVEYDSGLKVEQKEW